MIRNLALRYSYNSTLNNGPRVKNFFEINPIYPSAKQSDYKLYGFKRERYRFSELTYKGMLNSAMNTKQIADKLLSKSRLQKRRTAAKILLESQSKLPYGLGYDYYINIFKSRRIKRIDNNYIDAINNLIDKFQLKSQPELVRFFRLAMADLNKESFKEKIRGELVKNVVLEVAKTNAKNKYEKRISKESPPNQVVDQAQIDRLAFYKALEVIDENIKQAQSRLKISQRFSLRTQLFDTHFKPHTQYQLTPTRSENNFLASNSMTFGVKGITKFHTQRQFEDFVIQQRIRRLYFLEKVEGKTEQNKQKEEEKAQQILRKADLMKYEHIIDRLIYEFKLEDEVQESSIQDIYREVDSFIDNLRVGVKKDHDKAIDETVVTERMTKIRPIKQLLWENLTAEVVSAPISKQARLKELNETSQQIKYNLTDGESHQNKAYTVSPNYSLETSLNSIPFNIYKHSELEFLGAYMPSGIRAASLFDKTADISGRYPYFTFTQRMRRRKLRPAEIQEQYQYHAGGKRKTSMAVARIWRGEGIVRVNRKNIRDYFVDPYFRAQALKPLLLSGESGQFNVDFSVSGSGMHSQATACCLALARAFVTRNPGIKTLYRKAGLMTFDLRKKERKRIGKYKARKGYVYVRR